MIAIIDYGVGNLFSLRSSFSAIGKDAVVSSDEKVIKQADHILLPGVGAFKDAYLKLKQNGLDEVLKDCVRSGKPVMGVCLGMQLLFDESFEYGRCEGLGLIKGQIRDISETIPKGLKIPHMGWNSLVFHGDKHPLFKYIKEGEHVYFVHSFSAVGCEDSIIASAEYGAPLTAAVAKDNVSGCQFHPEKSGKAGLNILKAFCEM